MSEVESTKCESIEEVKNQEQNVERVMNTRRWCSVPLCKSRKYRSLHKFPRDPELRKKWAIACRIGKKITENMLVCRDHFLPADFIPRWDGRLRRLKTIAIPSQSLPTRPLDKKLTPAQMKRKDDRAARAAKRLERVIPRILKGSASTNKSVKDNDNCKKSEILDRDKLGDDAETDVDCSEPDVNLVTEQECQAVNDGSKTNRITYREYVSTSVCSCKSANKLIGENKSCYEVRAAKVLLEFNEIVDAMTRCSEIVFPIKDIVLKRVEEFYQCARRSHKVSFYSLLKSDNQLHAFTGIDLKLLEILNRSVNLCKELDSSKTELCVKEKIILSLVKLRWNISFSSLAYLFYINEYDCIRTFHTMLQILKSILKSAIYWPTQEDVMSFMPESLENLKKTIVVMDRNEIKVEKLSCPKCNLSINTLYNGSEKLKILLGFSQCGLITYVGKAQQGIGATKETIVDPCFISRILVPINDAIMTDGCFIEQDCNRLFLDLIKSRREKPFDPELMRTGNAKEKSTTYIESAYKRFQKYRFLKSNIMCDQASLIDDISVVICGIVNLGNPIIVNSFKNQKSES